MSRPAKDLYEHSLQGTRSVANLAQSHVAGSLPKAPRDLSKEERKRFKGYVRMLAERRAITAGDASLLAILVRTETRCQLAQEKLTTEGLVRIYARVANGEAIDVERPNLHLKILEVADRACVQILVRLGLTPRDREGVRPTSEARPKNAPPPEGTIEWLDYEAKRLREMAEEEPEAPELDDIDLNSIDEENHV